MFVYILIGAPIVPLNIVKLPYTIAQAHELQEPNWSIYRYVKVAEMFRNGLHAESSSNL